MLSSKEKSTGTGELTEQPHKKRKTINTDFIRALFILFPHLTTLFIKKKFQNQVSGMANRKKSCIEPKGFIYPKIL
jgi:hypothetical protein